MGGRLRLLTWILVFALGLALIVFLIGPALFASVVYPLPTQYQEALKRESAAYNISPNFLSALIFTESRWNPNAESHAGAGGLTQFIDSTAYAVAKRLGISPFHPDDLKKNPELAIKFGAYYISDGINRYGGDERLALIAYNGGGAAVNALRAGYPFGGTVAYANKVLSTEKIYDQIYGEWWKRENLPDLSPKPSSPADLITKIQITDFWRNLLFTREVPTTEEASTEDVSGFWQNLIR